MNPDLLGEGDQCGAGNGDFAASGEGAVQVFLVDFLQHQSKIVGLGVADIRERPLGAEDVLKGGLRRLFCPRQFAGGDMPRHNRHRFGEFGLRNIAVADFEMGLEFRPAGDDETGLLSLR